MFYFKLGEKSCPTPTARTCPRAESTVWISKTIGFHIHRIFADPFPFGWVPLFLKKYRQTETGVKKKKRTKAKTGKESNPTAYNAPSANIRK